MDLYQKMGSELRELFKDLFRSKQIPQIEKKMGQILETASKIGDPVSKEAKQLQADVERFLKDPKDPTSAAVMKQHALKLEQETREI